MRHKLSEREGGGRGWGIWVACGEAEVVSLSVKAGMMKGIIPEGQKRNSGSVSDIMYLRRTL